jgi:hypothetical protein
MFFKRNMADTNIQRVIEKWIRSEWMPATYGEDFFPGRVQFINGSKFAFDTVNVN